MNPGATVIAVSDGTGRRLDRKTNAEDVSDVECADRDRQRDNCGRGGARDGKVMHVVVVSGNRSSIGNRARGLGAAAEKVQFEGGAAELLNTKTAQGEVILDSQQLSSMPVDGGFDGVALVAPGVVSMHMDDLSNTIGANFSVNGERGRANNFAIDGRSNNGNTIAGPQVFFSNQDAIQKVEVIPNTFSDQYGRNIGQGKSRCQAKVRRVYKLWLISFQ